MGSTWLSHSIVINDKLYSYRCTACNLISPEKKNSMQRMRGQAGKIFGGTDRCTAGNSDCSTSVHNHIIGFLQASNTHTHIIMSDSTC